MRMRNNPKAIVWIQVGHATPRPHCCEIEETASRKYLVFKVENSRENCREEIDPALLLKLLPEQWEGAAYIYRPLIKLPGLI